MALTFNPSTLIIDSSTSIIDLPSFHAELRDWEDGETGAIHPITHTWKALDLGGGAAFVQADLVNGWQLRFPNAGNYTIKGNLNGSIVPVAGVYVERQTSSAYVTTAIGGSGPTPSDIAQAVWTRALEGTLTAEQLQRILLAALSGHTAGIGTNNEQYLSADGSKPRIDATFDSNGNRTNVTVDGA